MKRTMGVIVIMSFLLLGPGCISVQVFGGTYEGRIVDADTGAPVDGVVVLAIWYVEYRLADRWHEYYDASETVTDARGDFSVRELSLRLTKGELQPAMFFIFKAGYEVRELSSWASLKKDIVFSKRVKWEGERAIIPLKEVTIEQRKKGRAGGYRPPPMPDVPREKMPMTLKEINKDSVERGLGSVY